MTNWKTVRITCGTVALGLLVVASSHAWGVSHENKLTFSRPVALPGVVLPAGAYTFELAASTSSLVSCSSGKARRRLRHGVHHPVRARRHSKTRDTVVKRRRTTPDRSVVRDGVHRPRSLSIHHATPRQSFQLHDGSWGRVVRCNTQRRKSPIIGRSSDRAAVESSYERVRQGGRMMIGSRCDGAPVVSASSWRSRARVGLRHGTS